MGYHLRLRKNDTKLTQQTKESKRSSDTENVRKTKKMKSVTITLEDDDEPEIKTIAICIEDSTKANIQDLVDKQMTTKTNHESDRQDYNNPEIQNLPRQSN